MTDSCNEESASDMIKERREEKLNRYTDIRKEIKDSI